MSQTASTRTWNDQRIKQDRIALLQAEMKRRGIGGLYLKGGVTLRYALNLKVPGAQVFVPAAGEPIAFVRPRDEGYVSTQHENLRRPLGRAMRDVAAEVSGSSPFAKAFVALMAEHGIAGERIALDALEVGPMLDLVEAGVRLVDAEPLIERAWSVKTDDEVEIYRGIGDQYVETLHAFRDAIRPGTTERDLADVITSCWQQVGGEDIAQLNVCAGANMNPWRRWPTDRALAPGDFVGVDLHGRGANGLRGDGSTTFFVGDQPTAEQRDLYRRAVDHLQAVVPIWRAGRTIADAMADVPVVPDRFRKKLWDLNYAHGCGMGSSGYPHINPREDPIDDLLQENQVISLEIYFGEEGNPQAVKLEQMILIRDGEPELLGPIPLDSRFVP